jgi:hypothetical protein
MKAARPFAASAGLARGLVPAVEALRGLRSRHLAAALVVALLLALLGGFHLVVRYARGDPLLPLLSSSLVSGIVIVVAFVIADAYVRHGARPLLAHATALFAAAIVASIVKFHLTAALGGQNWFDPDVPLAVKRTEMLFVAILLMVQGGFGVAAYLQWRESETSARRLRASEMQRAKTERHMRQTQLLAMQARVEPELLFGALQRVGELAGTAASERADRLLDELIALLRLLMPDGSGLDDGDGTTVEHELATAVAYLRVHDACAGAAREIEIAIAPEAAAQALPPMLTLTIARMIVRREAAVRAPLRIRAGCADGTLTLDFARNDDDDAKPLIDQSDLVDLRRRLDKSFGTDTASLATADSAATLTLRLPLRP